ncbi:MAG TPA: dTMP kinase [archaeon]|nr:dTMP kinase [archaeon]
MTGKFIVLEGPDGSGKSTQIQMLADFFKSKNIQFVLTKNPTNGGIGTILREYYLKNNTHHLADALLFAADRAEQVETIIKPSLGQGKLVISDRYYHSNLVYQSAQGLNFNWLKQINKNFPKPDLTIVLDIDPAAALKRIDSERTQKEKFETLEFLKKIQKKYLQLPKKLKENIIVLDGNRTKEEVHANVFREVNKLINP